MHIFRFFFNVENSCCAPAAIYVMWFCSIIHRPNAQVQVSYQSHNVKWKAVLYKYTERVIYANLTLGELFRLFRVILVCEMRFDCGFFFFANSTGGWWQARVN